MSDSLRDQLLGLGYKPTPARTGKSGKPGKPAGGRQEGRKPAGKHPRQPARRPHGRRDLEMDLGKAYALRAHTEKQERIEAERIRQEQARDRRQARARLAELLEGKALNAADAEIARHFEYGGKIKRIHVTGAQLKAINAAELGVVQLNGRYLLVDAEVLAQAEAVFPQSVALKVDPQAPQADDPYADPRYRVPDDLVW